MTQPDVFRWLPLSDRKGLPTPRALFRDVPDAGGYLCRRTEERCYIEELGVDLKDGDVIVLSTHWGDTSGSTLAHEHRHFQQHYLLSLPPIGVVQPMEFDGSHESWTTGIRRFYWSQPWEMDALRYSMRVHRDETCVEQWEATC